MNPEKGEALAEVKKEHVEKLVVRKTTPEQMGAIPKRVEKVLAAKKRNPAADTSALEGEIDQQVYARYLPAPRLRQAGGLTPEEIKIVEESAK